MKTFHLERLSNDNTVDCTVPLGNLYWFSIRWNKDMGKQHHTDKITAGRFLGFTRSKNNNPRIKSQGTALLLWYGSVIFNSPLDQNNKGCYAPECSLEYGVQELTIICFNNNCGQWSSKCLFFYILINKTVENASSWHLRKIHLSGCHEKTRKLYR